MCAMALVHSRLRRVVFCRPDPAAGAVASRYRLHGERSLNHRCVSWTAPSVPESSTTLVALQLPQWTDYQTTMACGVMLQFVKLFGTAAHTWCSNQHVQCYQVLKCCAECRYQVYRLPLADDAVANGDERGSTAAAANGLKQG
jgi:hypothetical protein